MKMRLAIMALIAAGFPAFGQLAMQITPAGEGTIRCTVTNQASRTVRFLRHETPFANEFENGLFGITVNGKDVPYIGKMVLRARITAEDWMELQPGETVSTVVHLPDSYQFDEAGNYAVTFRRAVGVRYTDKHITRERREDTLAESAVMALEEDRQARTAPEESVQVESNTTDVFVSQPVAPRANYFAAADEQQATATRATNTYNGCSSSWINALNTDFPQGRNFAYNGYSKLYNKPVAQRPTYASYKTWYGTYSSSNYSVVLNGFARIYNSFGRGWTVNCNLGCQSNWAAYVYPNQTYIVQICNGYFSYPASERGTVLLHEASHWTAILGARDYAYFYTNCQNLAKTSPSKAIYNADNYHFFSMYAQ